MKKIQPNGPSGGRYYTDPNNSMLAYLAMDAPVTIDHMRDTDTHESFELLSKDTGVVIWEIGRQREYTPEGWRRVED